MKKLNLFNLLDTKSSSVLIVVFEFLDYYSINGFINYIFGGILY